MKTITGLTCQKCKRRACVTMETKEVKLILCEECLQEVLEKSFEAAFDENEKGIPA
jgi:hypothetical protein